MPACVCGAPLGVQNAHGRCVACTPHAGECIVPGCDGRVASYSVSRLCARHRRDCGMRRVRRELGVEGVRALPVEVSRG